MIYWKDNNSLWKPTSWGAEPVVSIVATILIMYTIPVTIHHRSTVLVICVRYPIRLGAMPDAIVEWSIIQPKPDCLMKFISQPYPHVINPKNNSKRISNKQEHKNICTLKKSCIFIDTSGSIRLKPPVVLNLMELWPYLGSYLAEWPTAILFIYSCFRKELYLTLL